MADSSRPYRAVFSDLAAATIIALPKRKQRQAFDRAIELARYPHLTSDYIVMDSDQRPIDHMLIDGFVFSYWIDHASSTVVFTEIDPV